MALLHEEEGDHIPQDKRKKQGWQPTPADILVDTYNNPYNSAIAELRQFAPLCKNMGE